MKKILSTFIITAFIAQAVMSAAPANAALNDWGTGSDDAAVALGENAEATGNNAIAIDGTATGAGSIAIGNLASASGFGGITIGGTASGSLSSAFGGDAVAAADSNVAIGNAAKTSEDAINSVVLGYGFYVDEADTVSVGSGGKALLDLGPKTRAISNVTARDIADKGTYAATTGQLCDINKSVADTLGITYEQLTEDAAEKKYFTIGGDETTKYTVQEAIDELYANSSSASDPLAVTYDDADKESVTLNNGGTPVELGNVKAMELNASSAYAVTGAQLFATNTTLGGLGTSAASVFGSGVSYADGAFTVTGTPFAGADTIAGGFTNLNSSLDSLGNSMAAMMGGGASYSGGSLSNFSVEINGTTFTDVASAISELAEGWTFSTTDATPPSGQGGAAGSSTILPGHTLTVNAGDNIDISGSDGDYTLSVSPDPTFDSVTADEITANDSLNIANKVTADDTGLTVAGTGTNSVKIDGDQFTLTGTDGSGGSHTLVISGGGMNMGGTKVANMASGEISETSTDGITGGQLWGLGDSVAGILGGGYQITSDGTLSSQDSKFTVNGQGYDTVADAISASMNSGGAGGSVSFADSDSITHEMDNGSYKFSVNPNLSLDSLNVAETVHISSSGINMGGTRLTGLADGGVYQGSTDAVTGNQLWDAYRRIDMIENELREDINIVGAHAAALSGLHPIQYNPYEPTTLSAAFGIYRDEYAVAVGVFQYVRENLMFNVGASLCSDGDLMGRAGVSLAIGRNTKRKPELARDMVGMQKQMYVMQAKLERLEEENRQSEAARRERTEQAHNRAERRDSAQKRRNYEAERGADPRAYEEARSKEVTPRAKRAPGARKGGKAAPSRRSSKKSAPEGVRVETLRLRL